MTRLAGAELAAGLHADRAVAGGGVGADFGLGAALDHDVGGFQHLVALDTARQHRGLDGLDRGAGEAQLGRADAAVIGDLEGDVEAAVAVVVAHDVGCMAPVKAASSLISPGSRSKVSAEIGGVAEAVLALQRAGDLRLDILAVDRAGQPRHRNFPEIAGVDADHLMRAQRVDHLGDRQRACGAEIRRAVDRDLRGRRRHCR